MCGFRQYSANPVFGVSFTVEDTAPSITDLKVPVQQDDIEIVDTEEASHDALAAYYADSSKGSDRYLTSLGCTIQFMEFLHPKTLCSMPFLETLRLHMTHFCGWTQGARVQSASGIGSRAAQGRCHHRAVVERALDLT